MPAVYSKFSKVHYEKDSPRIELRDVAGDADLGKTPAEFGLKVGHILRLWPTAATR